MPNVQKKLCSRKKHMVSVALFHKSKRTPDGLACWCISCEREYYKHYYHSNKKASKARAKKYESTAKGKLNIYRRGSRRRGIRWLLTQREFYKLVSCSCYWCGSEGGGVDRIDSKKGYSRENCVPCCKLCNVGKNDSPASVFVNWVLRAADHIRRVHGGNYA
jgi:hypothetical protein